MDEIELPDADDQRIAAETADRILRGFGMIEGRLESSSDYHYESVEAPVFLADVEGDVERFASQVRVVSEFAVPFPCRQMGDGDPVPLDLSDVWPVNSEQWRYNWPIPFRQFRNLREFEVIPVEPSMAISLFQRRMKTFLATRFFSARSQPTSSPGLQIEVVTRQSGERVHYSPAYFQRFSPVFGSPTTRVKGWIQPGMYTFSVTSSRGMKYDPAQFPIPPITVAQLKV